MLPSVVSSLEPFSDSEVSAVHETWNFEGNGTLMAIQHGPSLPCWVMALAQRFSSAPSNTPVVRCSATRTDRMRMNLRALRESGKHTESLAKRPLKHWERDEVCGVGWSINWEEQEHLSADLSIRYLCPRIRRETASKNQGGLRHRGSRNPCAGFMNTQSTSDPACDLQLQCTILYMQTPTSRHLPMMNFLSCSLFESAGQFRAWEVPLPCVTETR